MKLEIVKGCFGYDADRPLLKDVNIAVESGEIAAILGPNGIGKTTLLKCMTGILRWNAGCSMLDGEDIAKMPVRSVWQKIAYVPQARSTSLLYTGEEMVLLGRSAHLGMLQQPKARDREAADRAFALLNIGHLRHKRCGQMSGGELQMLMIARALTSEAKVLVLDEPESGLDFKNQLVILDLVRKLARQDGISCVFNTHYPAHALQIADKTLLLGRDGSSVFGNTGEIVSPERLRACFGVEVMIDAVQTPSGPYYSVIPVSVRED